MPDHRDYVEAARAALLDPSNRQGMGRHPDGFWNVVGLRVIEAVKNAGVEDEGEAVLIARQAVDELGGHYRRESIASQSLRPRPDTILHIFQVPQ